MYNIVGVDKTFEEARALVRPGCRMLSREDVIDEHDATAQFVSGLKNSAWVDASRNEDDSFVWSDGSPMTMGDAGFWASGEPNNFFSREAHVIMRTNGLLNDVNLDSKFTAVEACPVRRAR